MDPKRTDREARRKAATLSSKVFIMKVIMTEFLVARLSGWLLTGSIAALRVGNMALNTGECC